MSFLKKLTHDIDTHKRQKYFNRKEHIDSLIINRKRERASAFTSKGSLTLEAAVVVPIFFFAMLCLACLLEMMTIQTVMRNALYSVGKQLAQEAYVGLGSIPYTVERHMVSNIGVERLEQSMVVGGAEGIDCSESKIDRRTGVIDLSARFEIKLPIDIFRLLPIFYEEKLRVKGWTGYVSGVYEEQKVDMVYVTDAGTVYHRDEHCTYLDMTVHRILAETLEERRNISGGVYYPCESCEPDSEKETFCYITDYGSRYHSSLECKKIKRNVYAIPIEEAYGMGGCSKCVK